MKKRNYYITRECAYCRNIYGHRGKYNYTNSIPDKGGRHQCGERAQKPNVVRVAKAAQNRTRNRLAELP